MDEETLFHLALERLPHERAAFLDEACGGDERLRQRVGTLLCAHDDPATHLNPPEFAAPAPASTFAGPGAVVGRYKILEPIGEGGYGTVFMAEQSSPVRRKVALKIIKAGMDTKQVIARFEAERQALALLEHPNIARVFDAGVTDAGRPYFVMELIKGPPITAYSDGQKLAPRQRLELFVQVCQAVQHAHQKGIIHRDLKPANVLVAQYDGEPVPKVIDFGVAKATGPRLTEATVFTGFGDLIGTPQYMSPEQAELNQLDVDTRSDVYSLGVLLYELLTGTTPLEPKRLKEAALLEVLRVIREEEPPKPSTRLTTAAGLASVADLRGLEPRKLTGLVKGDLDWIVMKALEKDRRQRYETANALARDVERYLRDEPVEACPPSAGYRFRKFARRNRSGLAVATLALLLLASLGGAAGWVALQHAAQRKALEADVNRDLEEARDFCRQDRLREAASVLDRARVVAARRGADRQLVGRVAGLRSDVDMAARLQAIRLQHADVADEGFDAVGTARRYGQAFRDYGVDVDRVEPDRAAARIEACAIQGQLVAALDDWLLTQAADNQRRLLAVLARADDDPWRRRLRAAFAGENRDTLRELARDASASPPPADAALLGKALTLSGDWESAVEFLRRGQREHPGDFWLNECLGLSLIETKPPRAAEAVGYLRAAVALRPDSPGALYNLGFALDRQGDGPGALAVFRKAVGLKPDYAAGHMLLGNALRDHGDLPGAVAAHQKAIALKPDFHMAYYNLGHALKQQGDVAGAVAAYRKAIALRADYALPHFYLGTILHERGEVEGLAEMRRGYELGSNDPRWRDLSTRWLLELARAYVRWKRWDDAAAAFAKADLCARPLSDDAFAYACVCLLRGDDEGYDQFCQRMVRRAGEGDDWVEAFVLARTFVMARKSPVEPARTVQWASQSMEVGREPWYQHVVGLAQYRAGQFDQALDSLTIADADSWDNVDLNAFALALVHQRLGHVDEARECLDRGVQWLERARQPGPVRPGEPPLQDWIEGQVLRREAEELLGQSVPGRSPLP